MTLAGLTHIHVQILRETDKLITKYPLVFPQCLTEE